jgi:hypothetical protein
VGLGLGGYSERGQAPLIAVRIQSDGRSGEWPYLLARTRLEHRPCRFPLGCGFLSRRHKKEQPGLSPLTIIKGVCATASRRNVLANVGPGSYTSSDASVHARDRENCYRDSWCSHVIGSRSTRQIGAPIVPFRAIGLSGCFGKFSIDIYRANVSHGKRTSDYATRQLSLSTSLMLEHNILNFNLIII